MKPFLLLVFITLSSVLSASAQSESDTVSHATFEWGLKGGANMTKEVHVSTANSTSYRSDRGYGLIAGFWGRYGTPYFYFQPEAYVTSRNTILRDSANIPTKGIFLGSTSESNNATFTSVDVPLLIGTKFGMKGNNGFRLNAGPVFSLTFANQQTTANTTDDFAHLNYKTLNYGWAAGAGVDLWRFSLDFRYQSFLSKFNTYNGDQLRFNEFNLALAFRFSAL